MDWSNITWMLTGLAAVVVLLTRVRLGGAAGRRASGVSEVSSTLLTWHTAAGVVALVLWIAALVTGNGWFVFAGLVGWWVVTGVGLLLLARWLPSGGAHSDAKVTDEWGESAALSGLAHIGMLIGVAYFTYVAITGHL